MMTVDVSVTDWRRPDLLFRAAMAPAPCTGLESAELQHCWGCLWLLLPLATCPIQQKAMTGERR